MNRPPDRSQRSKAIPLPLLLAVFMTAAFGPTPAAPPAGPPTTKSAPSPQDEVARLLKEGRYPSAEEQARKLLVGVEKAHGPSSLEVAGVLDLLVEALWRGGRGRTPEARDLAQRALAIKERELGDHDPAIAPSLRNLGAVLEKSGDKAAAKALYERAIAIQERVFGPRHPELTRSLNALANFFVGTGDDASARPLYERALAIQEDAPARDDALVALLLHNLALLHYRAGDYPTAESMFVRTLALKEKVLGPDHLDVAWTLNALAVVLEEAGDYTGARPLYDRTLKIRESSLGPDHLHVGWVLNNLGILLRRTGDYAEAASCLERALAIQEKVLGPEDPDVAMTRYNLGQVHSLTGDLDGAKSQFELSLAIRLKTIGPDRNAVAEGLEALATVLAEKGDRGQARSLHEQALATWRKTVGPNHPDYTLGLRGLARLDLAEGDLDGARSLLEQTLSIQRLTLGPDHPGVAESLATLATILARTGDVGGALRYALLAEEIGRNHLKLTARTLSQREALRYASTRPSGLDTALSLASAGIGPVSRRAVWDALIRSRALVLDEMASRRHLSSLSGDPELVRLAGELVAASRRLANLSTRGPDPDRPQIYRDQLESARGSKEAAERALAETSAAFERDRVRENLGFAEVSSRLSPGSALVAYARYTRQPENAPAYLAFVLRGGENAPALVPLGPAASIDALVSSWAGEVGREPVADTRSVPDAEKAERSAGSALRAKIWDPLLPGIGKASRVFVVLDGSLHLVSLAALPVGKAAYLVESGPLVHYLSSERGVVSTGTGRERGQGLLALGGVAFDKVAAYPALNGTPVTPGAPGTGMVAAQAGFRGDRSACSEFQAIRFAPLPASAREVDTITALWKRAGGERAEAVALTGPQAGEAAFKKEAPGRRVLHLATHGFFLGGRCNPDQGTARGIGGLASPQERRPSPAVTESPLLRAGLALAGANLRQQAGPDDEDGILTAEEVAAMDLAGVEWAVLSACDTGVGELAAGEGVLGLRRALEVAGVETVIMSLWPVDDESALRWMQALYEERLVRGRATAEAVRAADLSLLRQRRQATGTAHPFYWAAFVAAGDWR